MAMIKASRRAGPLLATLAMLLSACIGGSESALRIETDAGVVDVRVEVADTPRERERGLMERTELPADAGMVFLHDQPAEGRFWMKNTLIPLSLAVWGEDARIAAILDMEPCRVVDCPVYDPGVSWVGALEVNRGFFDEHGVEVGDRVVLEGEG